MVDLSNFSLSQLLPYSLMQDPENKAMAEALTAMIKQVNKEIRNLDPKEPIPEHLLDIIAYEEHVDFYDQSLTVQQKRDLIDNNYFFHRHKGTPAAVEQLVRIILGEGKVVEWFEYDKEPGYFKVVTNNPAATNEMAEQFIRALNSSKRLTAWLDKVEITQVEQMNLYYGSVLHTGDKMILRQVT